MIYGTLANVQTLFTKYGMINETQVSSGMLNSGTWPSPIGTYTIGIRKLTAIPSQEGQMNSQVAHDKH